MFSIFPKKISDFYTSGVPKDIYCYRVCSLPVCLSVCLSVLCSLFSVRIRMAMYAKVIDGFS